jgi:uncharacterized membrane protein YdbT with pleckstrin-like domain
MFKERKRPFLGLPLSFTTYELSFDRFFIKSGVFVRHEDEVRLYRITDVSLRQSLLQRIFGVGDILVSSADASLGNFVIKDIKNPARCKEDLSMLVEKSRVSNRVVSREYMNDGEEL